MPSPSGLMVGWLDFLLICFIPASLMVWCSYVVVAIRERWRRKRDKETTAGR
jgi:hypothetical protein